MKKKIWVIGALLLGLGIIAYFAASENEAVGSGEDDGVADSRPDSHFEPRSSVKDKKKKDRAVMLNKALKVMKLQQDSSSKHTVQRS